MIISKFVMNTELKPFKNFNNLIEFLDQLLQKKNQYILVNNDSFPRIEVECKDCSADELNNLFSRLYQATLPIHFTITRTASANQNQNQNTYAQYNQYNQVFAKIFEKNAR